MNLALTEASISDEPVLANLLNLYLHDFSEVFGDPPGPDGRFVYERLPQYFSEPDRTPFLIRSDERLAGFALVSLGSLITGLRNTRDLSEFFVVRGLRGRGIGRAAASEVFKRFAGVWEVRALDQNPGAVEFWTNAIANHTGHAFTVEPWVSEPDLTWKVFRFAQSEAPVFEGGSSATPSASGESGGD